MSAVIHAVPTNVITGFLGAGKTTLIRSLLARKPLEERWAVLVNEFGEIGVDQALMGNPGEVFIREVAGGCICCTNFLPMQIALSQLLAKAKPQRLLIEPTGLGHPRQILESLSESHWQTTLSLRATLCVIDARQYEDERVKIHESFLAQAEVADVLVFSKDDCLTEIQRQSVLGFAASLPPPEREALFVAHGQLPLEVLDTPRREAAMVRRSLLHVRDNRPVALSQPVPKEPPYHYHHESLGMVAGGWVFPADWVFAHDPLLGLLFGLAADRVKGVFHTDKGWLNVNLTPRDAGITSREAGADNRLEVIRGEGVDWVALEAQLLSLRCSA